MKPLIGSLCIVAMGVAASAQNARPTASDLLSDIAAGALSPEDAVSAALAEMEAWSVLNGMANSNAGPDLAAYLETNMPGITIEDVAASIVSPDVAGTYTGLVIPGQLPTPDGAVVDGAPIYAAAIAEGRPAHIAAYETVFTDTGIDALLFPTVPQVAVAVGPEASSIETFFAFIRNTDPGSNAGLPGLGLAAGLGPETALPVGIELDGPAGSDRRLLALGMAIESLIGLTPLPAKP